MAQWSAFNKTISGKLIKNVPVAAPCYTGANQNAAQCAIVKTNWDDSVFQSHFPIGYSYPHTQSCDVPGGNTTTCTIGDSPVYAINASTPADVVAGVSYAVQKNLRIAIKMTGHDIIGRSTGGGSLEIWLRYLKSGVTVEETYEPTTTCSANYWTGSALKIGGGYQWADVYPVAKANNLIVVGGGCPDVGVIGGYTQGGGHSLAMRDFGIAADQLLEANIVLASGEEVVASPCQNSDLFTALRGGGGGTYGIITSAKIKAHPASKVTALTFSMAPLSIPATAAQMSDFMAALATVYQAFPSLNDGGLSGYGTWAAYSATPITGSSNTGLVWSFGAFGQTVAQVNTLWKPTCEKLAQYNATLNITTNKLPFANYFDYFYGTNGINSAAESESALVSRLFSKKHLSNTGALKIMLNATAGGPNEYTVNGFGLVGGGAVLAAPDKFSGVNPAWRSTYVMEYCARGWLETADYATVQAAHHDITYTKGAAMTTFAPDTGSYMSEGDWQDPNYLQNYYGGALSAHQAAKAKYDPNAQFYCPTCVGSADWAVDGTGHLCKVRWQ